MNINIISKSGKLPIYSSENAAGADLCAYLPNGDCSIGKGQWKLINTGLIAEIPVGYEGQIRPRSGIALKQGITVLNAPGTIDSDYRGEIGIILINHSNDVFIVNDGDRIAQLVITPIERAIFKLAEQLGETARAEGGFGSTGTN